MAQSWSIDELVFKTQNLPTFEFGPTWTKGINTVPSPIVAPTPTILEECTKEGKHIVGNRAIYSL